MEKKLIIFVVVGFLVLGVAIAGSTFFILSKINNTPVVEKSKESDTISIADLAKHELEEAITSNVYEENGMQHIAKVHKRHKSTKKNKHKKYKNAFLSVLSRFSKQGLTTTPFLRLMRSTGLKIPLNGIIRHSIASHIWKYTNFSLSRRRIRTYMTEIPTFQQLDT